MESNTRQHTKEVVKSWQNQAQTQRLSKEEGDRTYQKVLSLDLTLLAGQWITLSYK